MKKLNSTVPFHTIDGGSELVFEVATVKAIATWLQPQMLIKIGVDAYINRHRGQVGWLNSPKPSTYHRHKIQKKEKG